MGSVLCLFSGGIDSTVMVKHYLDRGWSVTGLYVDYGHDYQEKLAAKSVGESLNVTVLYSSTALLYPDGLFYPMRNAHLLTIAINHAYELKISRVAIGCTKSEYLDQRPEFIDRFNFMQEYSLKKPIWVLAPFANWSNEKVLKYGLKIKAPVGLTVSCSSGCGVCPKCKLRFKYNLEGLNEVDK